MTSRCEGGREAPSCGKRRTAWHRKTAHTSAAVPSLTLTPLPLAREILWTARPLRDPLNEPQPERALALTPKRTLSTRPLLTQEEMKEAKQAFVDKKAEVVAQKGSEVDVEVNTWLKKGPFTKMRKALRDAEWALKPEPPETHLVRSAELQRWEAAGDDEAAKRVVLAARVDADAAVAFKVRRRGK